MQTNLLHILITGPLFVYIGFVQPTHKWIYNFILISAILLAIWFIYHIIKYKLTRIWWIIHLLLIVPLLLYVGYMGPKTHPQVFQLILATGVLAIVYHIIRLIKKN
jgi:hypothetical protein